METKLQEATILLLKASLHCKDKETIIEIDNFLYNDNDKQRKTKKGLKEIRTYTKENGSKIMNTITNIRKLFL